MSTGADAADRSRACVRVTVSIARIGDGHHQMANVNGDLPGLFGNLIFDLIRVVGLPRQTSSSANVQLIEELTDAIEYGPPTEGELKVAFEVQNGEFTTEVTVPQATRTPAPEDSWFPPDVDTATRVKVPQQTIRRSRADLAKAVQERRVDRAQGAPGPTRLGAESQQRLDKPKGDDGSGGGEGGSPAPAAVVPLPKKP